MIDVRRLRVLVAVAEEGSFTAAAQRLYLTQSAVSQQMSVLEREIGISLLRRMPRGVVLTDAGAALVIRARHLFGEISAIEHEMQGFGENRREIRLGAFGTAGVELLPQALKAFKARRPDVRVLLSSPSDDATARLHDGDIEVLLVWEYNFAPQPLDRDLAQLRLPDDPLLVVLAADHPLAGETDVALNELANERWVVRSHRPPYEHAYETMCRIAGFEPDVAFRTDDYQSLQGLVAAGMGVSLAPALSLRPRRDDVVTLPCREPALTRSVTVLTLPEVSRTAPVADFLDVLREPA
jgi:DNA-binding transcriptional LysR family regulator